MARNSAPKPLGNGSNGSPLENRLIRCAIYTRKSTEEGLQQEFNSLDAQREAAEAFIVSQKHEGWQLVAERFDDGGYTGGNMDRPALKRFWPRSSRGPWTAWWSIRLTGSAAR